MIVVGGCCIRMRAEPIVILRVIVALCLVEMCSSSKAPTNYIRKTGKYPLEVHAMFREQLAKRIPKIPGMWSSWSAWTPCSRSCGGGVTVQTRQCVPKPSKIRFRRGQRRLRRQESKPACVGLYKRIHMCSTQDCSSGKDFRTEQCATFNNRPFKGKRFIWEPFLQAQDECALNCRALGQDFYAILNRTVIDGTRCNNPMTAHGKAAPRGKLGVCIDGYCKSVAANGVVGGLDENIEECSACLKGNCRSINGLYTRPDLPPGYSLVTQIPKGACRILVQQLKHTRNFIALRNANGSFIVNGDWQFSNSKVVEAAGTRFTYIKQDSTSMETVTAPGPLANAVDIMIVHYHPNQGIKYGYSLPSDQEIEQIAPPLLKRPISDSSNLEPRKLDLPPTNTLRDEAKPLHRRTRLRRKFAWKISGVTACSKTCGGGIQTTVLTCVREHTQTPVLDRRCAHLERPTPQTIRCNTQECPPRWGGYWQTCSGSCGQGVQHYVLQCEQEVTAGRTVIVNDMVCPRPKPTTSSRPCSLPPCENTSDNELLQNPEGVIKPSVKEWNVGSWSQCSVTCGSGHRSRSVTCPSGQCQPENRPSHVERCDNTPCSSTTSQSPFWLLSDWSECSVACGVGTQSRFAVCAQNDCDDKPEINRACSSDRNCGGQWFSGPWGSCSDSCSGPARQKRDVICIVRVRGQLRITTDMTCSMHSKPYAEQACEGTCPPRWLTGDWSTCEGHCPNGVQRRDVKCMDAQGRASNGCTVDEMPITKKPCICSRNDDVRDKYKPAQDEPVDRSCIDKIRNCYLAVQARLCQYPYYTSHCCVSCKKAQQDLLE